MKPIVFATGLLVTIVASRAALAIPGPVNTWVPLGPNTPISSVASASGVLLAGGSLGIFRSVDEGKTWTNVLPVTTTSVQFSPSDHGTAYAIAEGSAAGVWKSTNAGVLWSLTSALPQRLFTLRVSPRSSLNVWAGGDVGLFHTADGGNTWVRVLDKPYVFAVAVAPSDPTTVYAGTLVDGGYRTRDEGQTWSLIISSCPNCSASVDALAVDLADSRRVAASFAQNLPSPLPPSTPHTFYSADGGDSWKGSGLSSVHRDSLVAVPDTPGAFYAQAVGGLYLSRDGGASWVRLNSTEFFGPPSLSVHLSVDLDDGSLVYTGSSNGVLRLSAVFPQPATPVPALSPVGFGAFGALLAAVGLLVVMRGLR